MDKGTVRTLITGAGAPGIRGTLYALKNNNEGRKIYTVGIDMKNDVVGRFMVDSFYVVPSPEDVNYCSTLLDICRRESIDIIIPQTTRESYELSGHKTEFAQNGIQIMVSDRSAMEYANNKYNLLKVFEKLNLPYPKYYLAKSEFEIVTYASLLGYPDNPIVIKPPNSNGMRGLRILKESPWDIQRFLGEKPDGTEISLHDLLSILRKGSSWPELLVTEYLPGSEYSVDAFIGDNGSIAIPRFRKSIRSGISFENILNYREDISDFTIHAGKHIGLRYAFGFQYKLDQNGIPKVLECNPRIQGTMVASMFSGVNVIWLAVKETLGETPIIDKVRLKEAHFYRYWGGINVFEDNVDEI